MRSLLYALVGGGFTDASSLLPTRNNRFSPRATIEDASGFRDAMNHTSAGGSAVCVSGIVEVKASTDENLVFNYKMPTNQTQVTQTILDLWYSGSDFLDSIIHGKQHVAGSYNIGASLCMPPNSRPSKLQVLTHGIGFDRYYWDFAPGYSYVDSASEAGYATFFYDRLGVGVSSKENPLDTVQSPLERAILGELVKKIRSGSVGGRNFSTVIGVGHSFGSAITQGLTASSPGTLDAAVLTGFSVNASGMPVFSVGQHPAIASVNQPKRFGHLPNGYLVINNKISQQNTFFHSPSFAPDILAKAEATKATVTLGEYFTTSLIVKPASGFHGPVAVVDGNEDLGFCYANCSYPTNLLAEVPPKLFPGVSKNRITTYRAPSTGHAANLHFSARDTFQFIQKFLKDQGL